MDQIYFGIYLASDPFSNGGVLDQIRMLQAKLICSINRLQVCVHFGALNSSDHDYSRLEIFRW